MHDLISRQAAIDILEGFQVKVQNGEDFAYSWARMRMTELPSVQERKGRWIKDRLCSTNGGTYGVRRCSVCEAYYQDIGYGWNFCPHCGCAMTEGAEDE